MEDRLVKMADLCFFSISKRMMCVRRGTISFSFFAFIYLFSMTTFYMHQCPPSRALGLKIIPMEKFSDLLECSTQWPSPPDSPIHYHSYFISFAMVFLNCEFKLREEKSEDTA
ncbi:hypothetical protein YC2023_116802 [Brassica napus]